MRWPANIRRYLNLSKHVPVIFKVPFDLVEKIILFRVKENVVGKGRRGYYLVNAGSKKSMSRSSRMSRTKNLGNKLRLMPTLAIKMARML